MELQITTFYTQVKACDEIDLRDNRGKIHEAAFVIVQFVLALLSNRDGNMSRIHEHMEGKHAELVAFLELDTAPKHCISRAQLPVFLGKINYELLACFVVKNSTIVFKMSSVSWYALDGKELRGSIKKGSKRGEALVLAVRHKDREVVGQGYYNGEKESEIPAVRALLKERRLDHQNVTMDALHLNPTTLEGISKAGGKFLVGLKGNQEKLREIMYECSYNEEALYDRFDQEKSHGRVQERYYMSYDVSHIEFDERWAGVNFQTLIQVCRNQNVSNKEEEQYKVSNYLTNIPCKNVQTANELFDAVRNHWQVEVNNNIRDTALQEDKLRTSNLFMVRTISCLRTLVTRLLDEHETKNRRKKLDYFSEKLCLHFIK
jgi:predicted transposase YbfD/YdcC